MSSAGTTRPRDYRTAKRLAMDATALSIDLEVTLRDLSEVLNRHTRVVRWDGRTDRRRGDRRAAERVVRLARDEAAAA